MERWATFDCYGTLIDWDRGVRDTLARLWPGEDHDELVSDRQAVEALVERDGSLSYRAILERSLRGLAAIRALPLTNTGANALADSLPAWPPFSEVPAVLAELRRRGWRLGILSNTDPGLLDASIARLGVEIDVRVLASQIGSYKPRHRHWEEFRRVATPSVHVHVAASVFHDLEPCSRLGIPAVWINRTGQQASVARAAELESLVPLPATLDRVAHSSRQGGA